MSIGDPQPVVSGGPAGSADLDQLRALLAGQRSTLTQHLESLTGERIVADVVRQDLVDGTVPVPFSATTHGDAGPGKLAPVGRVARTAVLRGATSGRAYVRAVSVFEPERLPGQTRRLLRHSDTPIGRALLESGLVPTWEWTETLRAAPDPAVGFRSYRLGAGGEPLFVITEWFLRSLLGVSGL